jgi:hypothetical protein
MSEHADWPPSRTDNDNWIEHSKSFEVIEVPEAVADPPYTQGGAEAPLQTGLETPESAPDPTPVLDPDQ